MDDLIEDYKDTVLNDVAGGDYPAGLALKVRREITMDEFTIPVKIVNEMLEKARQAKVNSKPTPCALCKINIPIEGYVVCLKCMEASVK